jgi:hypothetical protein
VNKIQTTTRTPNCYESNMWREHDKLCHTAVHSAILSPHHLPCAITIEQMHDCRTLSNFPNIEQMDKKLLNSASKHRLLPDCHTISTCTPLTDMLSFPSTPTGAHLGHRSGTVCCGRQYTGKVTTFWFAIVSLIRRFWFASVS